MASGSPHPARAPLRALGVLGHKAHFTFPSAIATSCPRLHVVLLSLYHSAESPLTWDTGSPSAVIHLSSLIPPQVPKATWPAPVPPSIPASGSHAGARHLTG